MIKPTVNGVLGIMKACDKAKTVRRIIFTSSAGTVNVEEHCKNVYDENDWSDLEFIISKKMTGWVIETYNINHTSIKLNLGYMF